MKAVYDIDRFDIHYLTYGNEFPLATEDDDTIEGKKLAKGK